MAELASDSTLRELPSRFSLPLIGDTLAFVRDPAGFLQGRARELGPVFRIDVFGHPTACFVGPEAFAIVLDDRNVERAGANPPARRGDLRSPGDSFPGRRRAAQAQAPFD